MDKGVLKKFAIESRKDLMKIIENQLKMYYVDEEFEAIQTGDLVILKNDNHSLRPITIDIYNKRKALISRIYNLEIDSDFEKGKQQVIEEAAYTWFNRIIAIRYMELNDMLPLTADNNSLGIRVLSSKDNTPNPEIMKRNNLTNSLLDLGIDINEYDNIDKEKDKFNYILKKVCDKLSKIIPQVFGGNTDYIDILIPSNLLQENGFVNKLITEVPESNFKEGVEVIGWLYQYYIQEKHDSVINAKEIYKKEEIGAATQIFTPDWIVKYMVENSLGRYWIEHNESKELMEKWKYLVKENIKYSNNRLNPEMIKFIDPCCGSGHILVYAFEVMYQIYLNSGYNKKDISELILRNNLYGLDIDDRAGQLSILSLILKAREYDNNIFNKDILKEIKVMAIQETNNINRNSFDLLKKYGDDESFEIANYLYEKFQDAKEIGSLIIIDKKDYKKLNKYIKNIDEHNLDIYEREKFNALKDFITIAEVAQIISEDYSISVTNPPYLPSSLMSINLKKYVNTNYLFAKNDLYTAFIAKLIKLSSNGYQGFLAPYVWMYTDSYKTFRKYIVFNKNIISLVQLEYNSFEGATVPVATAILSNFNDSKGIYIDLSDFKGSAIQGPNTLNALNAENCNYKYLYNLKSSQELEGNIILFRASDKVIQALKTCSKLNEDEIPKVGLQSGNTNKFLRQWYEVSIDKICFDDIIKSKWYPLNKGGDFRKWYGNRTYIVNWENDGFEIKNYKDKNGKLKSRPQNINYYFKESISCSCLTSSTVSYRYYPAGAIFDVNFKSMFLKDNKFYILGLFNSAIIEKIGKIISPTMALNINDIQKFPIIYDKKYVDEINEIVKENIRLSKDDWDSFEISWEFKKHPLLNFKCNKIKEAMDKLEILWNENFEKLRKNEERLNDIYINIYNLNDEVSSKVLNQNVTINRINKEREIKSLISYSVGCMFGRYSLDKEGLIYAGGRFDKAKYKTFPVDEDNIIPIMEESYLNDDIVGKFREFIEVAFGNDYLEENLDFIASILGKKNNENSEETIRRYFINDFYKEHCHNYSGRGTGLKPIYWLFDSGKNNGFKALIYMHRYNENTVGKIRNEYLYKIQRIYETRLEEIKRTLNNPLGLSTYEVKNMEKEQQILNMKIEEIKTYNEKLSSIGDKKIKLDLDDGISVNYSKFDYIDPITQKKSSILANAKDIVQKNKE